MKLQLIIIGSGYKRIHKVADLLNQGSGSLLCESNVWLSDYNKIVWLIQVTQTSGNIAVQQVTTDFVITDYHYYIPQGMNNKEKKRCLGLCYRYPQDFVILNVDILWPWLVLKTCYIFFAALVTEETYFRLKTLLPSGISGIVHTNFKIQKRKTCTIVHPTTCVEYLKRWFYSDWKSS